MNNLTWSGAASVTELLDSAETGLQGVSRSMLMADPVAMQESQVILERLVDDLRRVKTAAGATGHVWPPDLGDRLQKFQGSLRRLQVLADATLSAVVFRSQSPALSTGYTARGSQPILTPEVTTLSVEC